MTFSGVLRGGGGKAPLSWLTCCKLKVDQNGVVTQGRMQDFPGGGNYKILKILDICPFPRNFLKMLQFRAF